MRRLLQHGAYLSLSPHCDSPFQDYVQSMTQSEILLSLNDVTLSLPGVDGPVAILKGIDGEIRAGEIVAITGRSGSGKSSLLAVATGLEPATSGSVKLLGTQLVGLNEDQLASVRRGRIGIVFQAFHLLPNMTALENVAIALETADLATGKAARDRAAQALDQVGLSHRLKHYPSQLSGGEQQRVAVARATVIEPKLIFADEPTGNLDQAAGQSVRDLLFGAARSQRAALVLVTHEASLATACDRIIHLDDGKVVS
jgi:putative ABC transport system ATP-binding protein